MCIGQDRFIPVHINVLKIHSKQRAQTLILPGLAPRAIPGEEGEGNEEERQPLRDAAERKKSVMRRAELKIDKKVTEME